MRSALLFLVVATLIIVPFLLFGDRIEALVREGLTRTAAAGALAQVACVLLLAGDVLLPVPSSVVSAVAVATWGPWWGALLSWIGMTLGSLLGYGLGRWAGGHRIGRWLGDSESRRLTDLYARHGEWIVLLLRPLPVLAEASSLFAGLSRMAWGRFLALSVAGNLLVSAFYAAAASLLLAIVTRSGPAALYGALGLTALAWLLWRHGRKGTA